MGKAENHLWLIEGITLIELILVMSIIAIISGALWGNFFPSLIKGRDSRRKQDLQSITRALEMYYNDNRSYPNPTVASTWGQSMQNPNNTTIIYMQKIPSDPAYPEYSYCYDSDGTYYKLYAHLENISDNDPKKLNPEVLCDTKYYNYGISSVNTTP